MSSTPRGRVSVLRMISLLLVAMMVAALLTACDDDDDQGGGRENDHSHHSRLGRITSVSSDGPTVEASPTAVAPPPALSPSPSSTPRTDTLSSGSYSSLNANGATIIFTSGVYVFNTIDAVNSTFELHGAVQIYMTGHLSLDHTAIVQNPSFLNPVDVPQNLIVYGPQTAAAGTFTFHHCGTVYGAVFAPQTDVTLSHGTALHGSVVARNFTADTSCSVVYDASLRTFELPGLGLTALTSLETVSVRPGR